MKSLIVAITLLAASTTFASTYLCSRTTPVPGASTYLLVISSQPTGIQMGQAVVLSQNSNVGPNWLLINGNAQVYRAPDSGPLTINASDDASKIDWSSPAIKNSCFISVRKMVFNLNESTKSVTGNMFNRAALAFNPNKSTDCPEAGAEYGAITMIPITCQPL